MLAALGVALESGLFAFLAEPRTLEELAAKATHLPATRVARVADVLVAAGVVVRESDDYRLAEGAMFALAYPAEAALTGEVRSALMQATAFLDAARAEPPVGWAHTNADLLRAQGASSAGFVPMFKGQIVPQLGNLGERLARPGARFLDVGIGVAALSIAMCRAWPSLCVVGLDPFDAPLALAKSAVEEAKLEGRIELRRIRVEALNEERSFDLAWLPAVFIGASALDKAIERVTASLREEGWLLVAMVPDQGDDVGHASWRLLNDLWGGECSSSSDMERRLVDAGLAEVRTIVGPPWAPCLVVGKRPS